MWEQSLSGLIKALRASKDDEARVIRQALDETKQEVRQLDPDLKAGALLKLCYLEMLGWPDLRAASFHVVECMSSPKLHIKQIGYLAAAQSFGPHTEVAMLTTNLVKKDLASPSPSTAPLLHSSTAPPPVLSLALSSLPHLLTPENSADLTPDLVTMLNHSRPAIRRRAVLVSHTLARQEATARPTVATYQDDADGFDGVTGGGVGGLRPTRENVWVERFRERLRDDDAGVVGATVNVVCELAMKDPEPWLEIAPELYGLLTAGNNNWMLIKIVKLFAVMTPIEPRLIKKLVPPLTNLIGTTSAMSLLYECISTIISGGLFNSPSGDVLASTCVEKLSQFLEDADQNLRYIALVALAKLVPHYPHLVARHHDTILESVDDPDETIRLRALDLVEGMVDRSNLQPIVVQLMGHLSPSTARRGGGAARSAAAMALAGASSAAGATPSLSSASYRSHLVNLILSVCARSTYAYVPDFHWYIDTLVSLTYISLSLPASLATDVVRPSAQSSSLGGRIAEHLIDVCARVKAVRPYATRAMLRLLTDDTFLSNVASDVRPSSTSSSTSVTGNDVSQVLSAAAWICGEYAANLEDPRPVISALFSDAISTAVPSRVLAVCIHNGVKVFARWTSDLRSGWECDGGRVGPDELDQVRKVVEAIAAQAARHCASADVELQQRAAEFVGLMDVLKQGLESYSPPAPPPSRPADYAFGSGGDEANPFEDPTAAEASPANDAETASTVGPTCLLLLDDLFFSHPLNPIASGAQAMIAPPEDLDLDSWISPSTMATSVGLDDDDGADVDEYGRRKFPESVSAAREEGEEVNGRGKKKGKRKKKDGKGKEKDDAEEGEDKEAIAKARAERLERQKDDPYYIPSAAAQAPDDDVDAIPIVKLDLSPAALSSPPAPRRPPTPPIIDIAGEMPASHLLRPARAKPVPPGSNGTANDGSSTPGSGPSRTATPVVEQQLVSGVPRKVVKKKRKPQSSSTTGP